MPAHTRGGHPIKVGARTGHESGGVALWAPGRHVRVPAPVIDPLVQLPALIRLRPCAERLLDRGTLTRGPRLGGLLPRPVGRLLRGGGGVMWAYGYSLPAPPGGFPLSTGRIEAWTSHSRRTPSRPRCDDVGRYGVPAPRPGSSSLMMVCETRRRHDATPLLLDDRALMH